MRILAVLFRCPVLALALAALASPLFAQGDANSLIAEGAAGPATLAGNAGLTDVFRVTITDQGAPGDGLATIVDAVTFNVTVSGAGDNAASFTWQLSNGTTNFAPTGGSATTVVFSGGNLITVANGGSGALTLRASVFAPSSTIDNKTLTFSVASADFTMGAAGTFLLGSQTVNGSVTPAVDVDASEVRVVSHPGASQTVGTSFGCSVAYTDSVGNRDLDVSDQITAARNDAGAVTSGGTATASNGLASFTITLGMPGNISSTLRLVFTDLAAGIDLSGAPVNSNTFNLVAVDDANSTLSDGAAGPATLSSVAGLTDVFNLVVTDTGLSDGKATIINVVTFTVSVSGPDDALDFNWQLFNGSANFAPSATTATTVSFTGSPLISAADGGSGTLTLRAQVNTTSDTIDNQTLAVSIAFADVTTSGSGTSLLSTTSASGAVDPVIAVVATTVQVVTQPGATQNVGSSFAVSVEYADAGGRRDLDISTDVIDAARNDAGAVSSGGAATASSGLASFNITLGMPGNASGTLRLVFTDQVSGDVNLNGSPVNSNAFNLVAGNDADSTLSEASPGPATLASTAGLTAVFNLGVTDSGVSDAKTTIVNGVTFNVTVSGGADDAGDFTWQLFNGSSTFAPSSSTATTVSFTGTPLLTVANGGNGTLTLRAQVNTTSDTIDNKTLSFSVAAANVTTGAAGTSMLPAATASSSVSTAVTVAATVNQVVLQPGGTQSVGVSFNASVEYCDAGGRRDLDISDDINVSRTDAGAVTLPSPAQATASGGLATFAVTLGMPGNISGSLRLRFTDQTGGAVNFNASPVTTNTFNLIAGDDANSTISAGTLSEPTTIASSSSGFVNVLDFRINDLGTSDGLATTVTDVVFNVGGSGDATEHSWRLNGPDVSNVIGVATATTITFSGLSISVANGGNETYTLALDLATNPVNTVDNENFTLAISSTGLTTGAGTTFAASGPINNGSGLTYTVTATQIQVVTQPGAVEAVGNAFTVTVHFADANGNRDLNATDTIDATRNDAGSITSGSSATASSGLATFNITLGMPGNTTGSLRLTFTDRTTGTFNFSGAPKNTNTFILNANNDANSTISENPGGPATLSSTAALTAVFNLRITDIGTSDGKATIINGITFTVTISGGSDDALDFAWELFNGSATFMPSASTATSVSFSATPLISVANGANGTLTLRARVNTASATIDNKTIDIQATSANITEDASGTTLAGSQTVNNATNTAVTVVATELRFVGAPPASAVVNTTINVTVEYTDVSGNRDLNVSGGSNDDVTVTWSGAGAVSNGQVNASSGVCVFGGANNLRIAPPGALAGTLTFDDDNTGGVSVPSIVITPFDLTDANDANSQVQAGPLSEPSTISSMAAGFTNVFDFRLRDFGTSDGLPTQVTQVVINVSGTANASEHSWRLNGPNVTNVVASATATTLTFTGLAISVPNGANQDFTVSVQLASAPVQTLDNTTFSLSLSNTGLTVPGSGSTTFTTSGPITNGTLTYTVVATRMTVKTQPGPTQVEGVGFDVVVAYTDNSGNVDVNVTDTITGMSRSDAGTVQAPAFPIASVNGVVSLTGANQVRLGLPAAASITLSFTDNAGGTLASANVVTSAFALGDNTPPTLTSAQLRITTDPRGRTIRLTFNEALRATSVTTLTNYTLSFGGLHPTSVSQPATSQIDLVFPDYAVAGLDTLAVANVQDTSNNPMAPVAAQAITSTDVAAPTLVSITYNDSDGSSTPTPGDQYLFLFSEAMNDRVFSGATAADTTLNPAGQSYGTPNDMSFGDDQGLATDSRLVIVTLVAGATVVGNEGITFSGLTDVSGNAVAATALTLITVDNISPRIVQTKLDDRDNNGNASLGDVLHIYFSEAINVAGVPLTNTAGEMNTALGLSSGGFGVDATAAFVTGNKELRITLGTGSPSIVGQTLNPPAAVTDPAGNPDATSPAVAIGNGTTDVFAPTFTLVYSAANPNAVPAGNLRITATFTDTQTITPTIAINQPGINDLPATNMVSVGGSTRVWQYDWTVSFADGTINIDGLNVLSITGRPTDLRGNVLVPASNNTFRTDTTNPAFSSVVITDADNYYRAGDTISMLATLGETGLTVTANLSVVDSALGTQVAFTDNGNGTYSLTSAALAALTLIEGSNIAITVRARDLALNTSTVPVLVNVDNTAPTASLVYDQPSVAVGAGNLTITLSLSEPSPTVPTIAITGLTGTPDVTATPMTGNAGSSSFTYILNVINPTTGTATVTIANVSDLAGNPPATVANASFTVNTAFTPLIANAGPDQTIDRPRQVTLDASSSTGANRTYVWTQDSGPAVTLTGAASERPTFYVQAAGAYVFRVTVTSGASSADDTVTITLNNSLPDIEAGERITLDRNDVVAGAAAIGLEGRALDVNGDALFVQWSLLASPPSGNLVPQNATSLVTALSVLGSSPMVAGLYTFQLRVFDPAGLLANTPSTDTVDVVVIAPGTIVPFAVCGPDMTASVGQQVTLSSLGSGDSDGTVVAWQWRPIARPAGSTALPSGAANATAQFTPDRAGIFVFGLRVTDDDNLTSTECVKTVIVHDLRSATFNYVPRAALAMSIADADSSGFANVGEAITLDGSASADADGDALTFKWRQTGGPVALQILNPGAAAITFTPATPGVYTVVLDLDDAGSSGIPASVSFAVAAAATPLPVAAAQISSADDSNADSRVLFIPGVGVDNQATNPAVDLDASASTGAALTFQWRQVAGPTAVLSGVTALAASFVPTTPGVYEFELVVVDSNGISASKRLRFAVNTYDATANPTGNELPVADAGADIASSGEKVTLDGSATDGNDTALSYHWVQVGGAPIILDTTVPAQPTFTPPSAGVYVFELYVDDGEGYGLAATVTVTDTSAGSSGGKGSDGGSCTTGELPSSAGLIAVSLLLALWLRRQRRRT